MDWVFGSLSKKKKGKNANKGKNGGIMAKGVKWKDGRWNNLPQQDVTLSTKGHFIVPLCISLSHKWGDLHVHGFLCVIHLEYYAKMCKMINHQSLFLSLEKELAKKREQ